MKLSKKTFKVTFICFFSLINTQCSNKPKFQNVKVPVPAPAQTTPTTVVLENCQFYKAQSLIINCYERYNFFEQGLADRKNITASVCAKQAFSQVWGANFSPSPYIYNPSAVKNTNFHWFFGFGNIQKGSPTAFPPNSLELKYQNLLNQFKISLDTNQMNQCLGGNYPFDGPTIISTSEQMIKLGNLEPKIFIKCYREQLEIYRVKKGCSL